jgi:hypothetical protein
MHVLMLPFAPRFILYTTAVAGTVSVALLALWQPAPLPFLSVLIGAFACFAVLGTVDLLQTRHAVLRNYPISAHLRFILEKIRPEMRQYFFEDEKHGLPFSRDKRAVVYQRAKNVLDKRPFGTQYDVYADGFEWLRPSIAPRPHATAPFRVPIVGPDCALPYCASLFNISVDGCGRARSPRGIRIGPFFAPGLGKRSHDVQTALSAARVRRIAAGNAGCAFFGSVEDGECHQLSPVAGHGRACHATAGIEPSRRRAGSRKVSVRYSG